MKKVLFITSLMSLGLLLTGCDQTTSTLFGAAGGTAIGAAMGNAIGGSGGATALGAVLGGLTGAALGSNAGARQAPCPPPPPPPVQVERTVYVRERGCHRHETIRHRNPCGHTEVYEYEEYCY